MPFAHQGAQRPKAAGRSSAPSTTPPRARGLELPTGPEERPARRESPPAVGGSVEVVTHTARVRWLIARNLIRILAATIAGVLALAATSRWTGVSLQEIQATVSPIFTALVSLVSSAVGFYFGTEKFNGSNAPSED